MKKLTDQELYKKCQKSKGLARLYYRFKFKRRGFDPDKMYSFFFWTDGSVFREKGHNSLGGLFKDIEYIETLEDNWDSYGGYAATPMAIDSVHAIVCNLEDATVRSLNDGGVYINLFESYGEKIQFKIGPDGIIKFRVFIENPEIYKRSDGKTVVYGNFEIYPSSS